jgi:hypothetical protein
MRWAAKNGIPLPAIYPEAKATHPPPMGSKTSAVRSATPGLPPPLIALGAKIVLRGPAGVRELELERFFISYGEQDRRPAEFVERIIILKPEFKPKYRQLYSSDLPPRPSRRRDAVVGKL